MLNVLLWMSKTMLGERNPGASCLWLCSWMRQNVSVFTVQTLPLCPLRELSALCQGFTPVAWPHTHTHTHTQEHTLLICLLVWVWETLANKQTPSRVTTYWFHAHRSRRVCHAEKTKSVSQQRTAFFERKHFSLNKMFYPFRERLQWRIWMKISENAAIFRSIR